MTYPADKVWLRNTQGVAGCIRSRGGCFKSWRQRPEEELVEDLITIISHFAGKLYGMRSHKYKEVVEG